MLRFGDQEKEIFGGETPTTNNRMELLAVIRALESLTRRCEVAVHTDSQYVQKGVSEWLPNWKKRGWKTADKKPVKNADLWQTLDALLPGGLGDRQRFRGGEQLSLEGALAQMARLGQLDRLSDQLLDATEPGALCPSYFLIRQTTGI